ncbi:hypothetical protein A6J60_009820 [Psychrobacter sp. FDAARGOS_221]|nr:hypothetical protein A6J60_009820 [Psychrobacter sp. FDAARGOS_221]
MALVIVLFMVLLLSAASVIALRDSQTSLDLTTAAQVNQLLFHASDVPLVRIEQVIQSPVLLSQWLSDIGPIGYLLRSGEQFATAEYVLCYQPTQRDTLYAGANQHKIISQSGLTQNKEGYCRINNSQSNYFTSARQVVATQVSLVRPDSLSPSVIDATQDTTTALVSQPVRIRTYVVSVMPILSDASLSEVEACLALSMVDRKLQHSLASNASDIASLSQVACLQQTQTPYNLQVQDYLYHPQTAKLIPLEWFDYGNHLDTSGGSL